MIATAAAESRHVDEASPKATRSATAAGPVADVALASLIGNRGVARMAGRAAARTAAVAPPVLDREAVARMAAGTEALADAVAARGRPPEQRALARQTTVQVQVGAGGCSIDQHHMIEPAVTTATQWLRRSIELLDAYVAAPDAPGNAATRTALRRNFRSTATADATHVRGRFATILNDMLTSPTLRTECHTDSDPTCGAAGAYVSGSLFVFCSSFFDKSPLGRAKSVIHEMAHALTGGPHITDRAYRSNRYYRWMTPAEALTNADSYGLLARELGTGAQVADTAPRDTIEDCPADWDLALARSTAIAERWNRNAQVALRDRRPTWLAGWTDLQTQYLGSTTTAALDAAQRVYDAAADAFESNIAYECEPGATGGRCATSTTYWYGAFSDFHVCPRWMALPTEPDRTRALLSGYYGYKDIEDSNDRRNNLAALARALNERYWPAPTP